jgi:hypothetical protein
MSNEKRINCEVGSGNYKAGNGHVLLVDTTLVFVCRDPGIAGDVSDGIDDVQAET